MKQTLTILILLLANIVFANTIVVGKNQLITSVKKGIESARDGDTVLLQKGIYREGNIIINKSISLIGINEPVLDGEHKYEILTVTGERILVRGIHFKNSGYSSMNDYASIKLVDTRYCFIENNTIEHSYFGIHVANASNCVIIDNKISGTPKTEQTSDNAIH